MEEKYNWNLKEIFASKEDFEKNENGNVRRVRRNKQIQRKFM